MGTWNASIAGNDTASDLRMEYAAAFFYYGVDEGVKKIDQYVREQGFDESNPEEWCDYFYSLAHFMWKKGVLTDEIRDKAIAMIDSEFGLELWAEAGAKMLNARRKKLAEFREMLQSPQPPRKKIKPNTYTEKIFEPGDVIAVQLQTVGKPYTENEQRPMSEAAFHALDGKYILMQLIECRSSWSSSIVPEVKDYWAHFRLFDGIYEEVPTEVDFAALRDAKIYVGSHISSTFVCESSLFYFKRRKYKWIGNWPARPAEKKRGLGNGVYWGINKPWKNPDSTLVAFMGAEITCGDFHGTMEQLRDICYYASCYGRFRHDLSQEENKKIFAEKAEQYQERVEQALAAGAKVLQITFGREVGVVTVRQKCIDDLYVWGRYQRNGLGTTLLAYAFSRAGEGAYMDVPKDNKELLRVCDKLGLAQSEVGAFVRVTMDRNS